ncbi:MAG: ATP-binding protein [Candidatus Thiodiazotropha endolucinida]
MGDGSNRCCHCTLDRVTRYRNRISGPLLKRIDMYVKVPRQPLQLYQQAPRQREESSEIIRRRVIDARLSPHPQGGAPSPTWRRVPRRRPRISARP